MRGRRGRSWRGGRGVEGSRFRVGTGGRRCKGRVRV